MKSVIINQPFGLGDILFIEPIYRHYHEQGLQVIAPIEDEYMWIKDYIQYVDFRKRSEFKMDYERTDMAYEYDGSRVIPLRFAHPLLRGYEPHYGDDKPNWMLDKYKWLQLPIDTWEGLRYTRNDKKENELFELLGITPGAYTFGNKNYGGGMTPADLPFDCDVMMCKIEGFTMLDWGKVIECAKEVHTVETSVFYMVHFIRPDCPCHIWPRVPWETKPHGVLNFIPSNWQIHEV